MPDRVNMHIANTLPGFWIEWKLNTRTRKSLDRRCLAKRLLPEDAFDFKAYWADKLNLVVLGH